MIECDGVEWNGQELRESGGRGLKGKRQGAVKWPAGPALWWHCSIFQEPEACPEGTEGQEAGPL